MVKKVVVPTLALCLTALVGFTAFGIWKSVSSRPTFPMDGYVLRGDGGEVKQLGFQGQESYQISRAGQVIFRDSDGERAVVRRESFAHLSDGSIMALCDSVLLDFNDLSENFINNYFITSKLPIASSGGIYTAETNSGTVNFGENLWKLSEEKYIVRSPELTIHFADGDDRPAGEYVQVTITPDGIVQLLTAENLWTTISPECYIQTQAGIKVYPISQIVDNGTNKLSLAKLSVSADDSIVLTESETRRQIVPELNIDTVDGEDGADGDAGENGEQGVAGEKGIDGEKGADGEQGIPGEDGQQGTAGQQGAAGQTGANGREGAAGAGGKNGTGGTDGYTGNKGNDATLQTSTNVALPVMTFTDWQVSATGLKGTIHVEDESGLLDLDVQNNSESYNPTVTIYNVDTGETVACYEVTDNTYNPNGAKDFTPGSFEHGGDTCFMTLKDPEGTRSTDVLTPDTNYRISVVAYYKMSDMIYSREFISRFFYTDSTGLYLDYDSATTSTLTINARVANAYQESIKIAEILLLTPEQNSKVTAASDACVAKYTLNYQDKMITYFDGVKSQTFPMGGDLGFEQSLTFGDIVSGATGLSPDEKYVARVFVTTGTADSVMSALTNQALEITTLRRAPTWWEPGQENNKPRPSANFNRVTGAFEIYRPPVTDVDGGAVRYVYTAMQQDENGNWVEVPGAKKTALPNETGPVNFFLPSGVDYKFKVDLEFNDNEKNVSYDLGMSDPIKSTGDTLPRLTLEVDQYGSDYNYMKGKLHIDLTQKSSALKVEPQKMLTLEVYADQLYDRKIQIEAPGTPAIETDQPNGGGQPIFTATLQKDDTTNRATVDLDLQNLYKNTNYTILVTGYIDLNDGNGPVRRALGTVSFATKNTYTLNAVWEQTTLSGGGADTSVSCNLKLQLQPEPTLDPNLAEKREAWAIRQLQQGQVTLKISRGTGPSRTPLSSITLNNNTEKKVEDLYDQGVLITEKDFTLALDAGTAYTLEVDVVTDQTYGMTSISYLNTFEVSVSTKTEVVTGAATPPDLLTDPTQGVKAIPIYNVDVGSYGGAQNEELPDDVIVGYRLESTYDNSQRLGLNVTYYAFEYNNYYNALKGGQDPVRLALNGEKTVTAIEPITIDFPVGSNEAPKVAVLFGGGGQRPVNESNNYYNGYSCYYTGDMDVSSGHLVGMDRGFRYVFAYTVEWSLDAAGSSQTYPYSPSSTYESYKNTYGCGKENGVTLGKGVAYILNSGMQEAPRLAPEFHTYVYDTPSSVWQENYGTTEGTLEIHYTWRDPDRTIVETGSTGSTATQIKYTQGETVISAPLFDAARKVQTTNVKAEDWYKYTITYGASSGGSNVVEPRVDVSLYKYDYNTVLTELGIGEANEDGGREEEFYLCHIPVDRAYGSRFEQLKAQNTHVYVNLDPHLDENYIDFTLRTEGSEGITTDLGRRAYAMKLDVKIVTATMGEDNHAKTIYLPMRYQMDKGYYARLATGTLGVDYVGKTFMAEAAVYYDTGVQGWKLIEGDGANFAMQYITQQDDTYRLGSYLASGSGTSGTYGAMAYQTGNPAMTADTIRGMIQSNAENDHTALLSIRGISEAWSLSRYIYPIQQGVAQSNSTNLEQMSNCIVPKGVGGYELEFVEGKNKCDLTHITPTIQKGEFLAGGNQVDIFNFTIISQEQAGTESFTLPDGTVSSDEYVVHALLFEKELDAKNFASTPSEENRKKFIPDSEITLRLNKSENPAQKGKPIADKVEGGVNKTGVICPMENGVPVLEKGRTYYVVFYMKDKEGENLVLVDQTTAEKAVYPFQTASGLTITSEDGLVYNNTGYFNKTLNLRFNLSRTSGVNMEYSLHSSNLCDATDIIYTDQQMRDNGMLNAKATGFTGSNNQATIQMMPSALRKDKLQPGRTYYLKLTATEAGGIEAGTQIFEVRLPPVTNYGALIYIGAASKDSITFTVSINDVGYSIMGHDKVAQGVGLYAVRFTDENGNWIQTIYDGQVFDASVPKQDFILKGGDQSDRTITQQGFELDNKAKHTYSINVYAVVDKDHDGLSELVRIPSGGTAGQDYKYFFGSVESATMESAGAEFAKFLRQFWAENATEEKLGFPKTSDSALWDIGLRFRLAQKGLQLTEDDGVYVNEQKAALSRRANRLLLTLSESFGIVVNSEDTATYPNGIQAFEAVEWQIEGYAGSGGSQTIVSYNEKTKTGDCPFKITTDMAGYNVYTYEIPHDVPLNGSYEVIIRLYRHASDPTYYKQLSFMFVG